MNLIANNYQHNYDYSNAELFTILNYRLRWVSLIDFAVTINHSYSSNKIHTLN